MNFIALTPVTDGHSFKIKSSLILAYQKERGGATKVFIDNSQNENLSNSYTVMETVESLDQAMSENLKDDKPRESFGKWAVIMTVGASSRLILKHESLEYAQYQARQIEALLNTEPHLRDFIKIFVSKNPTGD